MDIAFPDYENGILNIASSVLRHYGVPHRHPALPLLDKLLERPAKNTVFIVLDGLGSSSLDAFLPADSFLRSNKVADLSSVYPCTTAAATTTLMSGLSPAEHGWIGWSPWFREFGRMVDIFLDRDSFSGMPVVPSPAGQLLSYENIITQINRVNQRGLQINRIMPPFDANGVNSVNQMFERIRACCKLPGEQLILAYWHEPDSVMHSEGPHSDAARLQVVHEERLLVELYEEMADTRIILTADHGQVEITREIYLDEEPELNDWLIMPPSLEARMASLFVKPDRREDFARRFNEQFGDAFLLMPRSEVFERQLFGSGTLHRKVDDFVGDFLACATGSAIIRYHSLFNRPHETFKGHHAGLCHDEMTVPLVFASRD